MTSHNEKTFIFKALRQFLLALLLFLLILLLINYNVGFSYTGVCSGYDIYAVHEIYTHPEQTPIAVIVCSLCAGFV